MAWYYGTYSCGHEGRVNIVGPQKDRQMKSEWHFSGLCRECYKKSLEEEREKENMESARKSSEMEFPALTGTEKQVAWANTIRLSVFDSLDSACKKIEHALSEKGLEYIPGKEFGMKEIYDAVGYFIQSHTEAKYWIENRERKHTINEVMEDFEKNMESSYPECKSEENSCEKEFLTVCPENKKKAGIVKIHILDGIVFEIILHQGRVRTA